MWKYIYGVFSYHNLLANGIVPTLFEIVCEMWIWVL